MMAKRQAVSDKRAAAHRSGREVAHPGYRLAATRQGTGSRRHDGARAMTQQHRDAKVTASFLAHWEQSEDDKRVFTDFLKDAKRRRE
jgi:hypothetical protein